MPTLPEQITPEQSTAMVLHRPADTSLEPQTLDELKTFAETFSQAELLPKHLRGKPADLAITVLYGRELGLTPMQAIQDIFVIEGKPGVSAGLAVAKVKTSPVCEYFHRIESTATIATYETKRRGEPTPVRLSFTIEEARTAELTGKTNWKKFPAAMLRNRAAMQLARDVYPDVVRNIYDRDEVEEFASLSPTPFVAPPSMAAKAVEATVTERPAPIIEAPRPSTFESRIDSARTVSDLEALLAELAQLPDDDRKTKLRALYTAKKKGIIQPRSKPTWGDEPPAAAPPEPAVPETIREPGSDDEP
jgi:hypothetical protein